MRKKAKKAPTGAVNTYGVTIPITGRVYIEVQAESEEAAKDAAFERGAETEDIIEWEMHEQICQGNVFHGVQNEFDVELLEEDVLNESDSKEGA